MSVFYFEAQTGLFWDEEPKSPSNYYRYKLPEKTRRTVENAVDHAAQRMLDEGRGTLEYPETFLKMLEKADLSVRGPA